MRCIGAFALAVLLSACGDGWVGWYSGTVTADLTCSDGSSDHVGPEAGRWEIAERDNGQRIFRTSQCDVTINTDGDHLDVVPSLCTDTMGNRISFLGGSGLRNGGTLALDTNANATTSTGGTCSLQAVYDLQAEGG